jgi:hypothetical protein
VETVSEPQPAVEQNNDLSAASFRNERAVLPNNNNAASSVDDDTLIDRVRRLDCRQDVERLIVEILESPLRQRNSLLVQ